MVEKYQILAHGVDTDGIVSHTLFERNFRRQGIVSHFYCDYPDFLEKTKLLLEQDHLGYLVIADISLNDGFQDEEIFSQLKKKSKELIWYDHHEATEKNNSFLNRFFDRVIYSPNKCSAKLIQRDFLHNDKYEDFLAEIAQAHDFKRNQGKNRLLWSSGQDIQEIIGSGYNLDKLIIDLSEERVWWDWQSGELNSHYHDVVTEFAVRKKAACQRLELNTELVDILGTKVAISYSEPLLYMKDAPIHLMNNFDLDFAAVAYEGISNLIFFGRTKKALDFCNFMGGGGRGKGGGFSTNSLSSDLETVTQQNFPKIKELIKTNLEDFLKK